MDDATFHVLEQRVSEARSLREQICHLQRLITAAQTARGFKIAGFGSGPSFYPGDCYFSGFDVDAVKAALVNAYEAKLKDKQRQLAEL